MKSREAFSGRSFGHVTRDPIVKRSGGKSPNQRVLFVRSTFDWAVCSEPLARLRRTRDSIANLGWAVGEMQKLGLGLNGRGRMLQRLNGFKSAEPWNPWQKRAHRPCLTLYLKFRQPSRMRSANDMGASYARARCGPRVRAILPSA